MKIWKLECSHCGDPLYAWGYFKNKPTVVDLTARFKEYDSDIAEEEVSNYLIQGILQLIVMNST